MIGLLYKEAGEKRRRLEIEFKGKWNKTVRNAETGCVERLAGRIKEKGDKINRILKERRKKKRAKQLSKRQHGRPRLAVDSTDRLQNALMETRADAGYRKERITERVKTSLKREKSNGDSLVDELKWHDIGMTVGNRTSAGGTRSKKD